jgi:hypothetical protein
MTPLMMSITDIALTLSSCRALRCQMDRIILLPCAILLLEQSRELQRQLCLFMPGSSKASQIWGVASHTQHSTIPCCIGTTSHTMWWSYVWLYCGDTLGMQIHATVLESPDCTTTTLKCRVYFSKCVWDNYEHLIIFMSSVIFNHISVL